MSVTDPIADMITVIRNANRAKKPTADIRASKINEAILNVLKKEGFINNFKPMEHKNQGLFRVYLKYSGEKLSAISNLRRISKPGLRKYITKDEIPNVYGGLGLAVISTSRGLMTSIEAKEAGIGGELLLYVW